MNPKVKQKWMKALRSGKYSQAKNVLKSTKGGFCCLGVLCDLAAKEGVGSWEETTNCGQPQNNFVCNKMTGDTSSSTLPLAVRVWAGMRTSSGSFPLDLQVNTHNEVGDIRRACSLVDLNDARRKLNFDEIADVIQIVGDEL